ncbi:hypothetical protein DBV15_05214, partial [Temnothorax longispinosus]
MLRRARCRCQSMRRVGRAEQRDSAPLSPLTFSTATPLASSSTAVEYRDCSASVRLATAKARLGQRSRNASRRSGISPGYNWMEGKGGRTTGGPAPRCPVL